MDPGAQEIEDRLQASTRVESRTASSGFGTFPGVARAGTSPRRRPTVESGGQQRGTLSSRASSRMPRVPPINHRLQRKHEDTIGFPDRFLPVWRSGVPRAPSLRQPPPAEVDSDQGGIEDAPVREAGDVAKAGNRPARKHRKGTGVVAAANKLLETVYATFRHGTAYQPHAPEPESRKSLSADW